MLPIDPVLIALASEQGLLPDSRVPAAVGRETACAKCGAEIVADRHGWWVDSDGAAVCNEDEGSHEPASS